MREQVLSIAVLALLRNDGWRRSRVRQQTFLLAWRSVLLDADARGAYAFALHALRLHMVGARRAAWRRIDAWM